MLLVKSLEKALGRKAVLTDISFTAQPGEVFGLVGVNGAGKTTTMRICAGMLRPDAGAVTWHGESIDLDISRDFGFMPQEIGLYARQTVRRQLAYFGRLAGLDRAQARTRADEVVSDLGLEEYADMPVARLSGGNKRRVQLAVALLREPALLILDEPMTGLDPLAREYLADLVKAQAKRGCAVLFSSHELGVVEEICDRAVIIHNGVTVAQGTTSELARDVMQRSDGHVFEVTLHEPLDEVGLPSRGVELERPSPNVIRVRLPVQDTSDVSAHLRELAAMEGVRGVRVLEPSLQDVFGHVVRTADGPAGGTR